MTTKIAAGNLADPITAHIHTDMVTLRQDQTAIDAGIGRCKPTRPAVRSFVQLERLVDPSPI